MTVRTAWRRSDAALGGLGRPVAALACYSALFTPLALWALHTPQALGAGLAALVILATGAFAGMAALFLAWLGWSEARAARRRRQVNPLARRAAGGAAILAFPSSRGRGPRRRPW